MSYRLIYYNWSRKSCRTTKLFRYLLWANQSGQSEFHFCRRQFHCRWQFNKAKVTYFVHNSFQMQSSRNLHEMLHSLKNIVKIIARQNMQICLKYCRLITPMPKIHYSPVDVKWAHKYSSHNFTKKSFIILKLTCREECKMFFERATNLTQTL